MKNNKGITLVSLVITIVILLILSSITVSLVIPYFNKIKIIKLISNLQIVQSKIETIYENYLFDNTELIGNESIENLPNISIEEKGLIENKYSYSFDLMKWYKLSEIDLTKLGIDNKFLEKDSYLYINYENSEIIYSRGSELNDNIYYSLTGLEYIL